MSSMEQTRDCNCRGNSLAPGGFSTPGGSVRGFTGSGRAHGAGTFRKDSIDLEARELLRNNVFGSPAKTKEQESYP